MDDSSPTSPSLAGARPSPDIVAAWVAGWASSRGVGPARPRCGGLHIEVGLPRQRERYVFASIEKDALRNLALKITTPWTFLKVCAPSGEMETAWPAGWVVQEPGFMMTTKLARPPAAAALADGYRLTVQGEGVIVASVANEAGDVVASGKIALADRHATFDQIVTDEWHRRRGLGRAVMNALSAAAVERGVTEGVLVATPVGRELYAALGWCLHAHLTTAVIPGQEG
jgi:ribosomal protein S18 acetylase RimI-like enzyme